MLACRMPGSNSVSVDPFAAHTEDDHALGCHHRQSARPRSQPQSSDIEPPPHRLPLSHKSANLRLLKYSRSTQNLFDKLRSQPRTDIERQTTDNKHEDKENNAPPTDTTSTVDHQAYSLNSNTQPPWDDEAARLEAETDRMIAEQKRLDLVRLQEQLAAVKTPPRRLKRLILGKLSFPSRGKHAITKAKPRIMASPELGKRANPVFSSPPGRRVPTGPDRKAATPKGEALTPTSNLLEQRGNVLHGLRSWYHSNKRDGTQNKKRVPVSPDLTPHSSALYMIAVYPATLYDEEITDADIGIHQPMDIDNLDERIEKFSKPSREGSEIMREWSSTKSQPQVFDTSLYPDSHIELPDGILFGNVNKEIKTSCAFPTPITPQQDDLFANGIPGIDQRLRCPAITDPFHGKKRDHPSRKINTESVEHHISSSSSINLLDSSRHRDHDTLPSLQMSPTIQSSRRLQLALKAKSRPRRRASGPHKPATRMENDTITYSTGGKAKARSDPGAVASVSSLEHVPTLESIAIATQKLSEESAKFGGAVADVAPAIYTESLLETPIALSATSVSANPITSLRRSQSQDSLQEYPDTSDGLLTLAAVQQPGASLIAPIGNLTDLPWASGLYSDNLNDSESNYSANRSTIDSSTNWSADYVNLLKPTQTDDSTSRTTLDGCFDCCYSPVSSFNFVESSNNSCHRLLQRQNVIKELIDTERAFVRDMYIVDVVYRGTADACPLLDEQTLNVIFRNTSEVIALHTGLLARLEEAVSNVYVLNRECMSRANSASDPICLDDGKDEKEAKDRTTTVGSTFLADIETIKTVYKGFLSSSDQASKRLIQVQQDPTVKQWLNECKQAADDLTEAWDLDSLLIKPLQRITKYPTILFTLLQHTPWDHPDREPLMQAKYKLDKALIEINETMRDCKVAAQLMHTKQTRSDRTNGIAGAFGKGMAKIQARRPDSRGYDAYRSHQGYQNLDS
ncbi:hypothetical protein CC79DRAFT_1144241 [Sarocladium strictum]